MSRRQLWQIKCIMKWTDAQAPTSRENKAQYAYTSIVIVHVCFNNVSLKIEHCVRQRNTHHICPIIYVIWPGTPLKQDNLILTLTVARYRSVLGCNFLSKRMLRSYRSRQFLFPSSLSHRLPIIQQLGGVLMQFLGVGNARRYFSLEVYFFAVSVIELKNFN